MCIDDTQGFGGVRIYKGYAPTLRSQRSGLKIIVSGAMRGRYNSDGKTEQHLEIRKDDVSNTLTYCLKGLLSN